MKNTAKNPGKTGVLLINLGTPEDTSREQIAKYLKQFLMDPYVIDIPFPLRWMMVNLLILPKRPAAAAEAYKKIWTKEGSPLRVHHLAVTKKVQHALSDRYSVKAAMRYGTPSIENAVKELAQENVSEVIVVPLYPQYSLSATESSLIETRAQLKRYLPNVHTREIKPFYKYDLFIESFAEVARPVLKGFNQDFVLFSFHGLPVRHVKKTDLTRAHCSIRSGCCEKVESANENCYRAQCFETATLLARSLKLPADRYGVSFQSRLGRTEWIKPYTDEMYTDLAKRGIKRLAVVCPAFVADCLETLEEIGIRGRDDFRSKGGEDLCLVPSLNSSEMWVKAIAQMITDTSSD